LFPWDLIPASHVNGKVHIGRPKGSALLWPARVINNLNTDIGNVTLRQMQYISGFL
jgi:hypothetical protein